MNYSEINEKLAQHNPFIANVERSDTIWNKHLPDVIQHNSHVSLAIQKGLIHLANNSDSDSKVQSLTITGAIGRGKTQAFSRIKRYLFDENKVLFSYISGNKLKHNEQLYSWFRQSLMQDLGRARSKTPDISQLDEIAYFLFCCAEPGMSDIMHNPSHLKHRFDTARVQQEKHGKHFVECWANKIAKKFPGIDKYIARALLWSMSEEYGQAAVRWLEGREIDLDVAKTLKLTTNVNTDPEKSPQLAHIREQEGYEFLRNFLPIISSYKPLIIGFDELENTDFNSPQALTKAYVVANLIKTIFDSFHDFSKHQSKGLICILSVLGSIWEDDLGGGKVSVGLLNRLNTLSADKPLDLDELDGDTAVELVREWLDQRFYKRFEIEAPHPLYPFTQEEVRTWGSLRPTPRVLLDQCAKKIKVCDEEVFQDALRSQKSNKSIDTSKLKNSNFVGEILRFGFELLDELTEPINAVTKNGERIDQLFIDNITDEISIVKPSAEPKNLQPENYIEFKIEGKDARGQFCIAVGVNQGKSFSQLHAEMRRLSATERFGFTRSCLVRQEGLHFSGKKTNELRKKLEANHGEVVRFTLEQITPLWHLYELKCQVKSGDLGFSIRSLNDLILESELDTIINNPILLEILSSASPEPEEDDDDEEEDDDLLRTFLDQEDDNDDDDLLSAFKF